MFEEVIRAFWKRLRGRGQAYTRFTVKICPQTTKSHLRLDIWSRQTSTAVMVPLLITYLFKPNVGGKRLGLSGKAHDIGGAFAVNNLHKKGNLVDRLETTSREIRLCSTVPFLISLTTRMFGRRDNTFMESRV